MSLPYDASRTSLYSPEISSSVWIITSDPTPQALAVEASRLAYYRAEKSKVEFDRLKAAMLLVGFEDVVLFVNTASGTFGFGAVRKRDNTLLLAFRGTQPDDVADFATDLTVFPRPWAFGKGNVHAGFAEAYAGIHDAIQTWLATIAVKGQTIVTGHSLGGAIAALAAAVFKPSTLITFGCPRVGDSEFCVSLEGVNCVQFVNCCDIISRIPPKNFLKYSDICSPTYIDQFGVFLANPSDSTISSDQSSAREEYFLKHAWRVGNVLIRDLADHAPVNYVRSFY
jgi:hypothetical protein